MEKPYIVYVKTDSNGYITAVNSSAFLEDVTGWVEIDSGYSDKYHHAQGNYFSKSIVSVVGAYRYKFVDGKVLEVSDDDLQIQVEKGDMTELTLEERLSALERVSPVDSYTAGKWYNRGDRVFFNGKVYSCVAPDGVVCVWSPAEYPGYWVS